VNKVPRKKGYVPNKYTGRSMMVYGGKKKMQTGGRIISKAKGPRTVPVDTSAISKKKNIKMNMGGMGMSPMDEDMMGKMRKQMMGGSRMQYNQGSYVSVQDMEKHCSSKMKRNTMK